MSLADLIFELITKPWFLVQFFVEFLASTVYEISELVQVKKTSALISILKIKASNN